MTSTPSHDREQCLLQEGAALRALARSLVGDGHADDVVQATHAVALAAPAATDRFLLPWLRVTLRNLALGARRGEARRRAREHAVAVARANDGCDPASLVMQAELVRDVGAAVHALDEPFRTVLLLRFWHGLMPEAIAERLGVPRNTVRSRLQRGLERLREGLDREYGDRERWRPTLAAFGAPLVPDGGTSFWLAATGAIMHGKLMATGAALLVAAVASVWWWQQPLPQPGANATTGSGAAVVAAAAPDAPDASTRTAATPASSAPASAMATLPSPYHVLIRGRCLDERSNVVADAAVELRAVSPLPLASHDANVQTRSATDGTFALALLPAAVTYDLDVRAPDHVPVQAHWGEVEPGRTYELGDLVLQRGGAASGRVVDGAGTPQPGVGVRLARRGEPAPPAGTTSPAIMVDTRTNADGTFAVTGTLAAGEWIASLLPPHERDETASVARASFRIEAGANTTGVELVCAAATGALRAQVVDERGVGVVGASIALPRDMFGNSYVSDADGWFVLPRLARDTAATVTLRVSAPGLELVDTGPLPWDREARVVLPASPSVSLEVRSAATGAPIEVFGLRLAPAPDAPLAGGKRLIAALPRLPHPAGRVQLSGLPKASYVVWIDPDAADVAAFLGEFKVDRTPAHCVLLAPATGTRRVRVVDAATRPLAGTVVELVQSLRDERASVKTRALPPHELNGMTAVSVLRAPTDTAGEVELRAAAATPFTVRVLGPGHRPTTVTDVRLASGGESGLDVLVVQVDVGATVTGKVGPADMVAKLGARADEVQAMQNLGERGADMLGDMRAVVVLRPVGGGKDFPEKASDGAVQDDGTFRIDGVPPGSWRVCVRHRLQGPGHGSGMQSSTELATLRDLAPGEQRRVELDVSGLRSGSLRALVLVDGAPFANAKVQLRYRRDGLNWGSLELAEATPFPMTTDADARFAIDVPPGEYSVQVHLPDGRGGSAKQRTDQFVTVGAGGTTEATFPLLHRTLRVRVLRADGTPEVGRKFSALQPREVESAGTTDADGWLEIASVPVGPFDLVTWPTELTDVKAQTDYIRAHPYPQWLDVLVKVGPIEMATAQARSEIEVRLPPAAK